jgi:ubiquinol-cytochrome c reductase core subunit 2
LFDEAKEVAIAESHRAQSNISSFLIESLHELAFRHELGNSLYIPTNSNLSLKDVVAFHKQQLQADNVVIVGRGVSAEDIKSVVSPTLANVVGSQRASKSQSNYFGGSEIRKFAPGASHVSIAYRGAALSETKAVASAHVLRHLLQSHSNAAADSKLQFFSWNYSDNGLFGFCVSGQNAETANKVTQDVLSSLNKLASSPAESDAFDVAQARAKFDVAKNLECRFESLLTMASQVAQPFFPILEQLSDLTLLASTTRKCQHSSLAPRNPICVRQ